jgi:hypothetical protein
MAILRHRFTLHIHSPSKKLQRHYVWTSSKLAKTCFVYKIADLSTAMDSALPKRKPASGSMDLTRLRELRGYPCGRFS